MVNMEEMEATFFQKHPLLKDLLSLAGFIIAIVLGTIFLNTFIYRSYNVVGGSMENTLHGDDRVIVNRAAVSLLQVKIPNITTLRNLQVQLMAMR